MFCQMETVGSIDDVPCRYLPGRDIRVFAQARLTQSEDERLDYIYQSLSSLRFQSKAQLFQGNARSLRRQVLPLTGLL